MNRADRDDLIRLARSRARLAKLKASEREKVLLSEVEDLLAAEFEARDQIWADAVAIAEDAAAKANDVIAARCADLGIPAEYAPKLILHWAARNPETAGTPARRAELRRLALARLSALVASAKTQIDEQLLEVETALIAGGLASDDAREFLAAMPTAEMLMPPLTLDDLGLTTWQPPEGAAAALLTPRTPADRRRRRILRAIEANPAASDREIGRTLGVDHKTVGVYRRKTAGELPAPPGEIPDESGEISEDAGEAS